MDRVALGAWTTALDAWSEGQEFPGALTPAAFGLARPGGKVHQLPFGQTALTALAQPAALAAYLDHTLLRADALPAEVRQLAAEAAAHGCAGACVHAVHLRGLVEALGRAEVVPIAVVGFPHGAHRPEVKALEVQLALADGARELDAVAALGALRAGDVDRALADILAVVEAARPWPVKLILETGLLQRRAVVLGAGLALVAGCAAVKTSTGVVAPGARVEDVALLRAVVGDALAVKASGGVRTRAQALALVAAGASRLGTSASVSLVQG
ncbi:MAG: deoxyribose-phosphate aldolase [Myxococcaceae bacterium]